MSGQVRLAERLGRQVELDVRVGGVDLIAVDAAVQNADEGQQVDLQVPLQHVHVFADGAEGEDTARLGSALAASSPVVPNGRPLPASHHQEQR